jgi:hypothetical protein
LPVRLAGNGYDSTETTLLLFEPSDVVNTGDAGGELTAEVEQLT